MADKPRALQGNRDMIWSLLALLAICVVVALVSGNWSFGSSGSARDDKTPAFNATAALRADAAVMQFPIRVPVTPPGWKPNSGSSGAIGDNRVATVGYISSTSGMYIELNQSPAKEEALIADIGGTEALGDGVTQVGGQQWVRYTGPDGISVWIADLGAVRIAMSGKGPEDDFRTLGAAVVAAPPLALS